jgi:geranylgeranylglycerol-phosphate geranylgeranyltransferase
MGMMATAAELVRLRNATFGAAYTLLGAYLADDFARVVAVPVLVAAVVVLLVVACGNVTNDYRDASADAIAKPARPIPSGRVSRPVAGWIAIGLGVASVALASNLGPTLMIFALVTVVIGVAYSYVLKEIPLLGNASVGMLCGAILVFGALAAGGVTPPVVVSSTLTGLFVFAQEIFYTVEDEPGDRASGVRTVATTFGATNALRIFKVLAVLFVAVAVWPWFLGLAPDRYLYAVIVCTTSPMIGVLVLLNGSLEARTIDRASQLTRFIWLSSIVTLVLLK